MTPAEIIALIRRRADSWDAEAVEHRASHGRRESVTMRRIMRSKAKALRAVADDIEARCRAEEAPCP